MTQLSPQMRRFLAWALLAAVLALPYLLIIRPVIAHYQETAETISQRQELLARYRQIAAGRSAFEERLIQLQDDALQAGAYLSGDSEALVAAELQNQVRTLIEAEGGRLESTQILPGTDENGFRRVTIRVRMTADIDSLFRIAYALEGGQPYLFIDSIDINARQARTGRVISGEEGAMTVGCDVFGYMRQG
jgi:general secretion pathway protein M